MAEEEKTFRIRGRNQTCSGTECLVVGCNNRAGKDRVIGVQRSYFRLPHRDPKRLKLWVKAIPRKDWTPKEWHRICSDHFVGGKKTESEGSPGYIPSIFAVGKSTCRVTPKERRTRTALRTELTCIATPQTSTKKPPRKLFNPVWQSDHDYVVTRRDLNPPTDMDLMRKEILALQEENAALKDRVLNLDTIRDSDEDCVFYTNFPNYDVFKSLCDYLEGRSGGRLKYWRGSETGQSRHFSECGMTRKPGPQRKMSFEEEFFLTVVRLKIGGTAVDLGKRLGVDASYVSRVFTTWVHFLTQELTFLFEMKDDEEQVAECYQGMEHLTIVLDCTEQQVERSSDLQARKETYSNYKNRDTLKWLVGLSKNLTVNYVSAAYGGRASDKHITMHCGLLDLFKEGSAAMADRGFLVSAELKALGVELIIPDFKGSNRSQMKRSECENSENVAKMRIHIERMIQRIRTYHIFDVTAKLSMKDIYEAIFKTCAYLTNFQLPIIRPKETMPHDF